MLILHSHSSSAFFALYYNIHCNTCNLFPLCPEDGNSISRRNVSNRLPEHVVSKSNDSDLNIGILLLTVMLVVLLDCEKENGIYPFN